MKTIIIVAVGIAAFMGVSFLLDWNNYDVVVEKEEVIIIEEVPEWANDEEAVEAAQAVIRRKELEADKNRLEGQIEALESELEAVDKQLGLH